MAVTILYPEALYPDDSVERGIFGPDVNIVFRDTKELSELSDADCAAADGLMILRQAVTAADFARFTKLRCVVRMGVGYDRIDRVAAAKHQVMVCNVPDYGTTEVADHAIALALALRRGLLLHHHAQRQNPPAPWTVIRDPMVRRADVLTFGIVGTGRIATAAALRAKAFGYRVAFFDPYVPNGVDRALGITRVPTIEDLMRQSDTLSVHAPLTVETKGMLNRELLSLLPKGAIVVNTARGPIIDIDALHDLLKSGHLSAVGLDVVPVEPPVEPVPALLQAYRNREPWTEGRLIITPHSAFFTPEAWDDIRSKSAETIFAALLGPRPQNVITPEMF